MTPERIAELREIAAIQVNAYGEEGPDKSQELSECLDEIERLQKLLDRRTTETRGTGAHPASHMNQYPPFHAP